MALGLELSVARSEEPEYVDVAWELSFALAFISSSTISSFDREARRAFSSCSGSMIVVEKRSSMIARIGQ